MPDFLTKISLKVVGMVVGGLILLGLILFTFNQCSKRRSEAAQHKVEQAQAGAFQNSASDAVTNQGEVNQRAAESEALTRSNERTIRDAPGANDAVNPGVSGAGFASLCKRPSFRNSPTGRLRCAPPAGVAQRR